MGIYTIHPDKRSEVSCLCIAILVAYRLTENVALFAAEKAIGRWHRTICAFLLRKSKFGAVCSRMCLSSGIYRSFKKTY